MLLIIETGFLSIFLPETKGTGQLPDLDDLNDQESEKRLKKPVKPVPASERLRILGVLKLYHFLFLALFSGKDASQLHVRFLAKGFLL